MTSDLPPGEPFRLPVESLRRGDFAPRLRFDPRRLRSLSEAAARTGLVDPVAVWRRRGEFGKYTIAEGELRWHAAVRAGLSSIPVLVHTVPSERAAEKLTLLLSLRADLNGPHELSPIAEAEAYARLFQLKLSHRQIAAHLDKDRSAVSHVIHLLDLPLPVLHLVDVGALSAKHGRLLRPFRDRPDVQFYLAARTLADRWGCRRLARERPLTYAALPTPLPTTAALPAFEAACRQLRRLRLFPDASQTPAFTHRVQDQEAALLVAVLLESAGPTGALAAITSLAPHLERAARDLTLSLPLSPVSAHSDLTPIPIGDDAYVSGEEGQDDHDDPSLDRPRDLWAPWLHAIAHAERRLLWRIGMHAILQPAPAPAVVTSISSSGYLRAG